MKGAVVGHKINEKDKEFLRPIDRIIPGSKARSGNSSICDPRLQPPFPIITRS
jgi:hypothetical protein